MFHGPGDPGTITGVDKGLGPNDILNFSDTLALKNGSNLLTDLGSNLTIAKSATNSTSFAAGGGLQFALLDFSNNIIAAIDIDGNGTFSETDVALDVQDNVTSVSYNANNDVFTFIA